MIELAEKSFKEFCVANTTEIAVGLSISTEVSECQKSWSPPLLNQIKVNTNTVLVVNQVAGAGAVEKDSDGNILVAATWKLTLEVESHIAVAQACVLGLKLAKDCCFLDIVLESDNAEVILALKNRKVGDDYFGSL
ncbi:hypothetical protein AHAS_Ahas16G0136100 [Arachis hypogaea]